MPKSEKENLHLTPDALLLRLAKAKAAIEGRRIGDVFDEFLRKYIEPEEAKN